MADPLQALMQLVQGGGQGAPPPGPSAQPDVMAQLQALVGSGGGGGGGGMPPQGGAAPPAMSQAIASMMPPGLGAPDPRAMSLGVSGRTGPAMDSDYYDMHEANQGVRGDLPPKPQRDYSGYGEEMEPMDDPRQTPKPMSTQEELDDVSNKMGGTPEDNGDFPSQKEINALNAGKIDPKEFDRKWGKGAAAEMMKQGAEEDDGDEDDGDHEYR